MPQRVLGIDLGGHSVKVAHLEVGFRAMELAGLQIYDLLPGPESSLDRALGALAGVTAPDPADIVCVSLPGDRSIVRMYEVPFADPRKVQAVVSNELADDIPWEIDEIVFDQLATQPANGVLVAAARRDEVSEMLERLGRAGFVPRQLRVSSLSCAYLLRRVYGEDPVLLLDIGHLRTNFCLAANGRPLFGRTVSRGGHQITEALRQAFLLSYKEAETLKHQRGLVADDPSQLPPTEQRIAGVTARAIAPLARELRRTLAVACARCKVSPTRVVLCGGSSQLAGLDTYLAVEVDLPVQRLDVSSDPELAGMALSAEAQLVGALSLGLALEHGRRQNLDFRRGEFAYKADRSLLRDKAFGIVASLVAVLLFGALNAWASLYSLSTEQEALSQRLANQTRAVFGATVLDPRAAARRVMAGAKAHGGEIPTGTALDVLDRFSRAIPQQDEQKKKLEVDITKLDIRPGKTYVRGEAGSAGTVGKVIRSLEEDDCFPEVSAGKISEVAEGKKQFSLTVTTKCF